MEGVTATNGKEKVMFEHKTEEESTERDSFHGRRILSGVSCEKRRL